jgi:thiol:disulfide interchange protein
MNKSLTPFWIILAAAGIVIVTSLMRSGGGESKELIPWRSDLASAQAEAKKSNKPLFLYFTAAWCGPCQSLKTTTWADPSVKNALSSYVPVKIDIDEHPDLAKRYPAEGIPHFVVAQADGRPLRESVGAVPPGEFVAWLNGK